MGALTLSTAPAAEPVLLADAKAHMREDLDLAANNTLITALVKASKDKIEELTARRLIDQTWLWTLDAWPEQDFLRLPLAPLDSITSITTIDREGASEVFDATNYIVDPRNKPGRIVLKDGIQWPSPAGTLKEINGIEILLKVGYGTAGTDAPEGLLWAIKTLTAHLYENREPFAPIQLKSVPMSVRALIEPYRAWNRFGGTEK